MALGSIWFTLEEAASKYCLKNPVILNRIEAGVIRTEPADTRVVPINADKID